MNPVQNSIHYTQPGSMSQSPIVQNAVRPYLKQKGIGSVGPMFPENYRIRCPVVSPLQPDWPEFHNSLKRRYTEQMKDQNGTQTQVPNQRNGEDVYSRTYSIAPFYHSPFDMMVKSSLGRIESRDYGDYYKLLVELPGVKKEDVHIELEDNYLIVSCYRPDKESKSEYKVLYTERRTGDFERIFEILSDIDKDKITGDMKDGVLYITLPKKQTTKKPERKKIPML